MEDSTLMVAYISLKADLAELERDTMKARRIVDDKLSKPARINVNSEPLVQAGRAADVAASKIKGIAGVDMKPLARDSDWVTQAFLSIKQSSEEAAEGVRGIADADMSKAARGVDNLTNKVERLGAATKRASAHALITPQGGGGGAGGSGGLGFGGRVLATGVGSIAGRAVMGGGVAGAASGIASAAMASPALVGGIALAGAPLLGTAPAAAAY